MNTTTTTLHNPHQQGLYNLIVKADTCVTNYNTKAKTVIKQIVLKAFTWCQALYKCYHH